jgi:glycerol-3-phosphate acyltransferase PlsY
LGAFAALAFWPTLLAVAAILALISWKRYVSLGSIVGLALVPLLMLWWQRPLWESGLAAAITVLVVARHRGNIQRLRSGTERRLGERAEVAR